MLKPIFDEKFMIYDAKMVPLHNLDFNLGNFRSSRNGEQARFLEEIQNRPCQLTCGMRTIFRIFYACAEKFLLISVSFCASLPRHMVTM